MHMDDQKNARRYYGYQRQSDTKTDSSTKTKGTVKFARMLLIHLSLLKNKTIQIRLGQVR